jgi:SET domain-containing protein
MQLASKTNSKVKLKNSRTGKGLFASKEILKNEVIVDFSTGPGQYINTKESDVLFDKGQDYMIQIEDDLFFAAVSQNEIEEADFINHSCDPNSGIKGSQIIVAMRNIKKGDEITIDYAMTESSTFKINCQCSSKKCRKTITGNDWKNPVLQKKYKNYFSNYLKTKINISPLKCHHTEK